MKWFIDFFKRLFGKKEVQHPEVPLNPTKPLEPIVPPLVEPMSLNQKAFEVAKKELGISEVPGSGNNPRVIEYHRATSLKSTQDSVPWCSAFANFCIVKAGGLGTNSAVARSWLHWGKEINAPMTGDVVVFSSPARGPEAGHVAFFVEKSSFGFIKVLGGNQNDEVCYKDEPTFLVLGYRRSNET